MGRVRTKTVKKAARVIVEKYYSQLTLDFQTNKRVCAEVAVIPSKRLRNKIAGFVTHLMKRIQAGTVRGISLRLQEEERERRMDYVPEVSWVDETISSGLTVDDEVYNMLDTIGFAESVRVVKPTPPEETTTQRAPQRRQPRESRPQTQQ